MDFYKGSIPVIGDEPEAMGMLFPGKAGHIGSQEVGFGYVPRDMSVHPPEMFQAPSEIALIPDSEWDARYDEEEATQSSLEHLYLRGGKPAFVNLDQGQMPDCWCYSTGHAIMFDRLKQGLPLVRLSPSGAATLMNQTGGGWCGMSAKFARENGYPVEGAGPGQWPEHSRGGHDTPELRAAMAQFKTQEEWVDLTRAVYDQNLTAAMIATCHFNKIPAPTDYNWWGHSVVSLRTVRIEKGRWGRLILNSWLNWGRFGLAVLEGSKLNTAGALAIRMTKAA